MGGAVDLHNDFFEWIVDGDNLHHGAWHHDFAHADFRSGQRAFDN